MNTDANTKKNTENRAARAFDASHATFLQPGPSTPRDENTNKNTENRAARAFDASHATFLQPGPSTSRAPAPIRHPDMTQTWSQMAYGGSHGTIEQPSPYAPNFQIYWPQPEPSYIPLSSQNTLPPLSQISQICFRPPFPLAPQVPSNSQISLAPQVPSYTQISLGVPFPTSVSQIPVARLREVRPGKAISSKRNCERTTSGLTFKPYHRSHRSHHPIATVLPTSTCTQQPAYPIHSTDFQFGTNPHSPQYVRYRHHVQSQQYQPNLDQAHLEQHLSPPQYSSAATATITEPQKTVDNTVSVIRSTAEESKKNRSLQNQERKEAQSQPESWARKINEIYENRTTPEFLSMARQLLRPWAPEVGNINLTTAEVNFVARQMLMPPELDNETPPIELSHSPDDAESAQRPHLRTPSPTPAPAHQFPRAGSPSPYIPNPAIYCPRPRIVTRAPAEEGQHQLQRRPRSWIVPPTPLPVPGPHCPGPRTPPQREAAPAPAHQRP